MGDEEIAKLKQLEERIEQLERQALAYLPLGPKQECFAPDPAIVDRLVQAAKAAIEAAPPPPPPADRSKRCMTDGSPEGSREEYQQIDPVTGQQKGYVALCPAERAKGFVRPVRNTYRHKTCNTTTTMGMALAETYARDPGFYSGTFCCSCRGHFPLDEFMWEGTTEQVGL
jgi:hypothetical protein